MSKKRKRKPRETRGTPCPACGEARELWWHGRRYLCEPCLEKLAHPIERTPVTATELLRGAWQLGKEIGPKAALVTAVLSVPSVALSVYGETIMSPGASIVGVILLSLVQIAAVPIGAELGLRVLDGEPPMLGPSVRTGLAKYFPLLFGMLVQQLIIEVYTLLLIVPGFIKASSYAVLAPLIVSDEAGALSALEESRKRMEGHRLRVFPALLLVWLPGILGQLYQLTVGPVGLATGPARPAWAIAADPYITLALPLLDLPWLFVVLALHAKLRRAQRVRFVPDEDEA